MLPPHRQRFETTWWKLISSGAQLGDDLSGLSRLLNRLLPLRRASSTKAKRRQLLGVFDDMDVRFDEPEGALNEMTNTQLRKRKPGFGRAKALFATQGQEARPSAITSAGMARFRLTGFNPDGSLHFRGDVVQELVGKGRAEIATKQQHSRKLLEKERKLRAGHTTIGETPTQAKEPQSDFAEDYTALRTRTLVHEHAGPSFRRQTPKGSGRRGSRKATASMASDSPVAGTSSEAPTSHANQSQAAPKSAALADDPLSPSAMFLHSVAKRAPEVSSSNKQVASLSQNIRHARASTGKFPQVGSIAQGRHAEPEAVVSLTRRIHEASTTDRKSVV